MSAGTAGKLRMIKDGLVRLTGLKHVWLEDVFMSCSRLVSEPKRHQSNFVMSNRASKARGCCIVRMLPCKFFVVDGNMQGFLR